jgi:Mce-associated membrane protein
MTKPDSTPERDERSRDEHPPDDTTKESEVAVPVKNDAVTEEPPTGAAESDEAQSDEAQSDEAQSDDAESDEAAADLENEHAVDTKTGIAWSRVLAFGVLPALALLLAGGAGFLKWQDSSVRASDIARIESVQAARDSTIALLSYRPDTVEKDLGAARDRLTGNFRDSYTSLTHDVVIPGAKQRQISAVATVPAAASVSATPNHAVVLVFVNQTVIVGTAPPSDTASSVRVTLDKTGDRWLISDFTPV